MTRPVAAHLCGLRRLAAMLVEPHEALDRRRVPTICLSRVVPRAGELELYAPTHPLFVAPGRRSAGPAKVYQQG